MKTLAEKPTVIKTMKFLPTASLVQYKSNPRKNDDQVDRMAALLREFGLRAPLLVHEVDGRTEVVDGHLRLKAATKMGLAEVPTVDVSDLSEAQVRALRLAMNKSAEFAEWDDELLAQELRAIEALGMGLDLTGFGDDELARLLGEEQASEPSNAGALAAAFGVPPFTVLNAREGWWQDRKRAWLALGIASELGRGMQAVETNVVAAGQGGMAQASGERLSHTARQPNAIIGGSPMPLDRAKDAGRKRANATPGGGHDAGR